MEKFYQYWRRQEGGIWFSQLNCSSVRLQMRRLVAGGWLKICPAKSQPRYDGLVDW